MQQARVWVFKIKNGAHKGRLVIPCDFGYDDSTTIPKQGHPNDGFTQHLQRRPWRNLKLGGTITPKMNECQVIEVADGNGTLAHEHALVLSSAIVAPMPLVMMAALPGRHPVDVPVLVEPVCQASISTVFMAG